MNEMLQLILYLLETNLFLCKNAENYALTASSASVLAQFNDDYLSLMVKVFGGQCAGELMDGLKTLSRNSLTEEDLQPCLHRIDELMQQRPTLRHLCRSIIREQYKDLPTSALISTVFTVQLQDYLLYTPI